MWRGVSEGGKEMSGKVVQLRREREDERKAAQRYVQRSTDKGEEVKWEGSVGKAVSADHLPVIHVRSRLL